MKSALLLLPLIATFAGCASPPLGYEYPAPQCDSAVETGCIARMFPPTEPVITQSHAADARIEKPDGSELCVPRNYLELWSESKRTESEAICNVHAGSLLPIGRYFDCVQTREDGCERPAIAVALEGGGTKSAPFSLGVLAGLQRSGVLPAVELVGSASGGSYAAYFYFARLIERELEPQGTETPVSAWFRDCMPSYYRVKGVAPPTLLLDADYCKELDEATGVFHKLVEGNEFEKRFPYQYQAKVGRDLLALHQSLRLDEEQRNWRDFAPAAFGVSFLVAAHAATVVPHLFTSALFDMPINYSPSREAYRAGIERGYGYSARDWHEALRLEDPAFTDPPANERWIGTRFQRNWEMADLADAYERAHRRCPDLRKPCDFPLWILSAVSSAGRSHDFWVRPQPRDFQRFSFELGPRGHGSGQLGFIDIPPRLPLRSAVGASAAFLDDQQRAIAENTMLRAVASAFVFFGNLNWGTSIANFNTSAAKRVGSSLTPFPAYWMSYFQGLRAGHIHLADGGNVDNLGVIALLRRGARNIVVSASTEDRDGEFPSLCRLKNDLELQVSRGTDGRMDRLSVYDVLAPALGDLGRVCNRQLGKQEVSVWGRDAVRKLVCDRAPGANCDEEFQRVLDGKHEVAGYNFWHWPLPVLDACVVRRKDPRQDKPVAETCEDARNDLDPRGVSRELSRLFIIKPALASPVAYREQMSGDAIRWCAWGNDGKARGDVPPGTQPGGMDLPCATLAYLSAVPPGPQECAHRKHAFPQDEFIGMTIHSGYTLFGAYYDLGRHLAGQIRVDESAKRCGTALCVDHPYTGAPVSPCR